MSLERLDDKDLVEALEAASAQLASVVLEMQRRRQQAEAIPTLPPGASWQARAVHAASGMLLTAMRKNPMRFGMIMCLCFAYVGMLIMKAFK